MSITFRVIISDINACQVSRLVWWIHHIGLNILSIIYGPALLFNYWVSYHKCAAIKNADGCCLLTISLIVKSEKKKKKKNSLTLKSDHRLSMDYKFVWIEFVYAPFLLELDVEKVLGSKNLAIGLVGLNYVLHESLYETVTRDAFVGNMNGLACILGSLSF